MKKFRIMKHILAVLSSRELRFKGFTLVEFLVGFSIFAIIGVISVSILFVVLRTTKKSDLIVSLKQDGNTAVSQVVKSIRYAKSLDSPAPCVTPVVGTSITVTSLAENKQAIFACIGGSSPTITLNGDSLIDTNYASVSNCSFTCSQASLNDPPTIKFNFKLSAKNPSTLVESTGSVPFETSVTLRNYNR